MWLRDGRSTLDLFGRGFVLLVFGGEASAAAGLSATAQQLGVPLQTVCIEEAEARSVYEKRYVLVRPDGHVAWRGNEMPEDAAAILGKISGQLRTINETIPV